MNGVVEEEVYVVQPLGSETHDRDSYMCRTWYGRIDSFLSSLGFTKNKADSNLYYKVEEGNPVILLCG